MKRLTILFVMLGLLCIQLASAQTREISGTVTSAETGEPIPGATVVVKGTTIGTITDPDGNYNFEVPDDADILVFSFVGMQSKEVQLNGSTNIDVALEEDVVGLDEVVVVGYGTQKRVNLTGSQSNVMGEGLEEMPIIGVDQALQGRAAGVQVTQQSGLPGSGISVRVRGHASITASNEPLYIVDGVPVNTVNNIDAIENDLGGYGFGGQGSNSIANINPSDIESIEVLKDAAATSIYGSRASNGVVLITTKRGRPSENTKISFNAFWGQQEVTKMLEFLPADKYIDVVNEARANAGLDPLARYQNDDGKEFDTDWLNEVFRTAPVQSYDLSASGGNEKTQFYLSGSYYEQDGIQIGSGYDRITTKVNLDHKASKRLHFSSSNLVSHASGSLTSNDNYIIGVLPTATAARPDYPIYNELGNYQSIPNTFDNPVAAGKEYINTYRDMRYLGNLSATLSLLENFNFKSSVGVDYNQYHADNYWTTKVLGGILSGNGYAENSVLENQRYTWENTLNYSNILNDIHNIDVLVGQSIENHDYYTVLVAGTDFPSDFLRTLNSSATPLTSSGFKTSDGLLSFFTRLNYVLSEKYMFSVSMRADGSSRFAEKYRYGYFPSFSAGWRLSKESFMQNANFLDNLKLRASYGITGNNTIPDFAYLPLFQSGSNYLSQGGISPAQLPNDELRWEQTAQTNVGVDFTIFRRFTGSFDYYVKNTTDLLLAAPVPSSSGFISITQNIGEMKNVGWEAYLSAAIFEATDAFNWTLTANITQNRNTIEQLVTGEDMQAAGFDQSIIREGEALGSFYGYKVEGIFQSQAEIDNAAFQSAATAPGDYQFQDSNGDGVITSDDRVIIGNPNPDYFGGLTSNMRYKGIDLSVFFQFSLGNDVYWWAQNQYTAMMNQDNLLSKVEDRWQQPGDDTDVPRAVWGDPNNNTRRSDRYVHDGSYIRLKNLQLGYTLPTSLVQRAGISKLRVYVQAQNLITFTDYPGFDPEVSTFADTNTGIGVDNQTYPHARIVSFGVGLGF